MKNVIVVNNKVGTLANLKNSLPEMNTQQIWNKFNNQIYFFILKRVKEKEISNEILQNSFLKIHSNLNQIKDKDKVKSWVFQIVRNEISNYFNQESKHKKEVSFDGVVNSEVRKNYCCMDRFIQELPDIYKETIELVYVEGKKQLDVAHILGISLYNVKARIRRGKSILKERFNTCCKYQFNRNGKLVGESDCSYCD